MYDYDTYSDQATNWYRRPVVLIGIGATLILVGVIYGAFLLFGGEPLSEEEQVVVEQIEETSQEECGADGNTEGCEVDLIYTNAKELGSVEICRLMEKEEDVDSCIMAVARKWDRPDYCSEIGNKEVSEHCESLLYFFMAMEYQDESYCLKIPAQEPQASCHLRFEGPLTQENCRDRISETEYCDDLDTIAHAQLTSNAHLCYQLKTLNGWIECIDLVGYPDDDGDGLTLSEEDIMGTSDLDEDTDDDELSDFYEAKEYFTNPLDDDTDDDTYLDGEEVASGYNPRGEGRL
jgi:hypothetical protein